MSRFTRSTIAVVGLVLALAAGSFASPAHATPAGTTYYVDSSSATCDDTGGGVSAQAPWCSLDAASGAYEPGDQILLARGSAYEGQFLEVSGQGTAQARIRVGAYGEGAAPSLDGDASAGKALVLLKNPSYVSVSDLELGYAGAGVLAQYRDEFPGSATGNRSLEFTDLIVHHISGIGSARVDGGPQDVFCDSNDLDLWQSGGAAIGADFDIDVPTNSYLVAGVTFERIIGHDNLNVINVDVCDGRVGAPNAPEPASPHLVRDVVINNVDAYDGNGAGYDQLCNEGMRINGSTGVTIMNSRFENLGACHVAGGTAGFILVAVEDVTFKNNIIAGVPNTGSPDMTAIDNELYVDDVTLQNNLIARNAGPGVEFLSLRNGIGDYNTNHLIDGNTFYGNGGGSLYRLNPSNSPMTGSIVDNLVADDRFVAPAQDFVPLVKTGARNVAGAEGLDPFYAAEQFASSAGAHGWVYQYRDGAGTWQAATYSGSEHMHGVWGDGADRRVAAFEQTADTARVWSAPQDGTVAIRGLAFKTRSGGSAVTASIEHNGVATTSASILASETTGVPVDGQLTVSAGDTVRFVVAGTATAEDWTSWVPSLMYIASPTVATGELHNSSFETPFTGGIEYAPADSAWEFSPYAPGVGAGVAGNGSEFGNAAAPQGRQVGFLQTAGSMTQRIDGLSPDVGYTISFDVAARGGEQQKVEVLWNGTVVGEVTPSSASFSRYTSSPVTGAAGVNTLTLRGASSGDQTAFIDQVAVELVTTVAGVQFINPGFEQPAVSGIAYAPTGSSWTFPVSVGGSGDGIARNGSAFGQQNAPEGQQSAFVQRQGTFSQTVTGLDVGEPYALRFHAAQRGSEQQSIAVFANDEQIGVITPSSSGWQLHTTAPFIVNAATVTFSFRGQSTQDQTAFIDAPVLLAVSPAAP